MAQTRRGFTLIELLVVIAIIAILAAILFPVFARARAKAQQNTCLSNVKQINLALIMYAGDYDQQFVWPGGAGYLGNQWVDRIVPYVKNDQIFTCPVDEMNELGYTGNEQKSRSYNLNYYYGTLMGAYPSSAEAMSYPAEMWCLIDGINGTGVRYAYTNDLDNNTIISGSLGGAVWRHNEGCNLGYVDGHAKWQAGKWLMTMMPYVAPPPTTENSKFWIGK